VNPATKLSIKEKLFAHIETWRPYTVLWCGLVSLAGACLTWKSLPPLHITIFVILAPMCGWIAGLYLSDFLDRKLDAIEKPHRPIPSGRIKPKEALIAGGIFVIIGTILSIYLGVNNFLLVFIVAILVLLYTYFSKSRGIIGNLNRGFVTVIAFLYGAFSSNDPITSLPLYIWILTPVFLLHDTNSNLVGAIRDMEGDKKGGYQTIPVKYGIKISIIISIILSIAWVSMVIMIPYYYQFVSPAYYYILILDIGILLSFYIYFFYSLKNYSREKALNYHEFFVIERITLASAFIFGIVNPLTAGIIYAITLLLTIFFQALLRKRYEFEV